MKTTELNLLTNSELAEKLASLKSELFNLRFTHATGSLTNSSELSICKRNIARHPCFTSSPLRSGHCCHRSYFQKAAPGIERRNENCHLFR